MADGMLSRDELLQYRRELVRQLADVDALLAEQQQPAEPLEASRRAGEQQPEPDPAAVLPPVEERSYWVERRPLAAGLPGPKRIVHRAECWRGGQADARSRGTGRQSLEEFLRDPHAAVCEVCAPSRDLQATPPHTWV